MRRINRWLLVASLSLTGAFSAFASQAFGGRSTRSTHAASGATASVSAQPTAQAPTQVQGNTDALPPGQVAPAPTPAPSGAAASAAGSSDGSSAPSSAAPAGVDPNAAAQQSAQAPQYSSAPPVVVSGGS